MTAVPRESQQRFLRGFECYVRTNFDLICPQGLSSIVTTGISHRPRDLTLPTKIESKLDFTWPVA